MLQDEPNAAFQKIMYILNGQTVGSCLAWERFTQQRGGKVVRHKASPLPALALTVWRAAGPRHPRACWELCGARVGCGEALLEGHVAWEAWPLLGAYDALYCLSGPYVYDSLPLQPLVFHLSNSSPPSAACRGTGLALVRSCTKQACGSSVNKATVPSARFLPDDLKLYVVRFVSITAEVLNFPVWNCSHSLYLDLYLDEGLVTPTCLICILQPVGQE